MSGEFNRVFGEFSMLACQVGIIMCLVKFNVRRIVGFNHTFTVSDTMCGI
jgi:hypothetical protein